MFRALRADEIELRVGTVGRSGNGFSLLCYKDARCDMNILDEVYGPEYWQRDHKEVKGNMYGGVGIYNKELHEWIWKWDCGTESNTASEKGEASDSFKRACFALGIGRELYTSPFIWIKDHVDYTNGKYIPDNKFVAGLRVSLVEYEETETKRTISKLIIEDAAGNEVFSHGVKSTRKKSEKKTDKKSSEPKAPPALSRDEVITKIVALCDAKMVDVGAMCKKVKVDSLEELNDDRLHKCLEYVQSL